MKERARRGHRETFALHTGNFRVPALWTRSRGPISGRKQSTQTGRLPNKIEIIEMILGMELRLDTEYGGSLQQGNEGIEGRDYMRATIAVAEGRALSMCFTVGFSTRRNIPVGAMRLTATGRSRFDLRRSSFRTHFTATACFRRAIFLFYRVGERINTRRQYGSECSGKEQYEISALH